MLNVLPVVCYWRCALMERCRNPWNKECKNTNIEVYIVYNGMKRPICRRCWSKIAKKNLEW